MFNFNKNIIKIMAVCLLISLSLPSEARTKKKKTSSGLKSTYLTYHKGKLKRRYHRGNGPDLKKITTDPTLFVEKPLNGVNAIENTYRN